MEQDLNAASGGGTQTTTQDPQSASSSSLAPTTEGLQSSSVNLFSSSNGISLNQSSISAVGLKTSTEAKTAPATPVKLKPHQPNWVLLGAFIAIMILAVIMFWRIAVSEKSTTD